MKRVALSGPSRALFAAAALGNAALAVEAVCLWRVRTRRLPAPAAFPACSILKPLSGPEEDLEGNLESHLALDYPGEWELLLGVRDEGTPVHALAEAFAARHPGRVRLVVHEEESARNPKMSQLIALTREAAHELIVCTDSGIRVPPGYLREIAAALAQPGVGLATHMVAGVGERSLGAAFDNQALNTFVIPNVAVAAAIRMDQVVGRSLALPRDVLERMGGWESVKDVLGEDKQLGSQLGELGLRSHVCPAPVENFQRERSLGAFWARHTRWALIRFRLLRPGFFLEPLLNPTLFAVLGLACSPRSARARLAAAGSCAAAAALAQASALLARGHGFRPSHLALFPLQQLVFFLAWARGATIRTVSWQGRSWRIGAKARISGTFVLEAE